MFLLYFLDTYINLVKYLQRVPLDVSTNWRYLRQDAGKTYSEISKMRSYWKYSKATICRHMKKNTADLVPMKDYSGDTPKTVCSTKEKYLMTNQVLARRVMVKAGIPVSISGVTVRRVLWKTGLRWTNFQRKGILTKNDLKMRLKFARKVCCKRAMFNYEIWNHQEAYGTREGRT